MYIPISLLRRHVRESNLIENIRYRSGVRLVASHLNAAVQVVRRTARGELLDPLHIHSLLCRGTSMEGFGGKKRTCNVCVGKYDMPRWREVTRLLNLWRGTVQYYDKRMKDAPKKERERIARILHELFLCVHPFEDGNGRTSRLILNMLRLRWGLEWLVVENRRKGFYYRQIRHTQDTIFRPCYPNVFPEDERRRLRRRLEAERAWIDAYEDLPTGRVSMRNSIRPRR
ncbi:MAG: Fic family protein [Patescibacteria group bacterium]